MVLARISALFGPLMASAALKRIWALSWTGFRSHSFLAATDATMALLISSWMYSSKEVEEEEGKKEEKEEEEEDNFMRKASFRTEQTNQLWRIVLKTLEWWKMF